jgi:HK97 family phage major capsid protein
MPLNIIGRADVGDALLPEQTIKEIIQEAPKASLVLNRAKQVRLSTKKAKQPVLASLPEAYWVDGDTGLKQTTKNTWGKVNITAEELAVIVPIPDAVVDDADIPLWDAVRPLIVEAIGKKVDEAVLFGNDKPTSWPEAIIPAAIAAGNVVVRGTGSDFGVDVAALGAKIAKQGFGINSFASKPGLQWELVGLRNANGNPLYTPSLAAGAPSGLYGYPLNEVDNGAWDDEAAELLAVDWSKFVIGIRQDITWDWFREGVITDADNKILINLMQQDTKALRVVFRIGYTSAVPITRIGTGTKYPAGVITPGTDPSGALKVEVTNWPPAPELEG